MSDAPQVIAQRTSPGCIELTINRPRARNALSANLVDEMLDHLDAACREGISVLVIRAVPPAFSGGFDLVGIDQESDASLLWRFARVGLLMEQLMRSPFETVAVVEGPAIGAGADLALACDRRIGSTEALFRFPGAQFGVVLGTQRLSSLVGQAAALRLTAGGQVLTAVDAAQLGLLEVVESDEIVHEIDRLVGGVGRLPGRTIRELAAAARTTATPDPLAALTRSIAGQPGIADRIRSFINATQRKPVGAS